MTVFSIESEDAVGVPDNGGQPEARKSHDSDCLDVQQTARHQIFPLLQDAAQLEAAYHVVPAAENTKAQDPNRYLEPHQEKAYGKTNRPHPNAHRITPNYYRARLFVTL